MGPASGGTELLTWMASRPLNLPRQGQTISLGQRDDGTLELLDSAQRHVVRTFPKGMPPFILRQFPDRRRLLVSPDGTSFEIRDWSRGAFCAPSRLTGIPRT